MNKVLRKIYIQKDDIGIAPHSHLESVSVSEFYIANENDRMKERRKKRDPNKPITN